MGAAGSGSDEIHISVTEKSLSRLRPRMVEQRDGLLTSARAGFCFRGPECDLRQKLLPTKHGIPSYHPEGDIRQQEISGDGIRDRSESGQLRLPPGTQHL